MNLLPNKGAVLPEIAHQASDLWNPARVKTPKAEVIKVQFYDVILQPHSH